MCIQGTKCMLYPKVLFETRLPRFPASEDGRVGVDSWTLHGQLGGIWDEVVFLAFDIQAKGTGKRLI